MRFNPFAAVSCKYGAPMGRRADTGAYAALRDHPKLFARHQGGSEGYDRGGAYWGTPSNVWAVWGRLDGKVVCTYTRAANREAAIRNVREGV